MADGYGFAVGWAGGAVRFQPYQPSFGLDFGFVGAQDFRRFAVEADGNVGSQLWVFLLQARRFAADEIEMGQIVMVIALPA